MDKINILTGDDREEEIENEKGFYEKKFGTMPKE